MMMLAIALTLAPLDDGYAKCMDAAQTNADFSACGNAMVERREAELNRVWKATIKGLDKPTRDALIAEERAWAAFKDKSCAYLTTGFYGRDGQTVHVYTCLEGVIDQRIEYLENVGTDGEQEGEPDQDGEAPRGT